MIGLVDATRDAKVFELVFIPTVLQEIFGVAVVVEFEFIREVS